MNFPMNEEEFVNAVKHYSCEQLKLRSNEALSVLYMYLM